MLQTKIAYLKEKLAKLPAEPGVYMFKNKSGGIIYIGKSGNLKNRVRSYFNKGTRFFNATKLKMLTEIAGIEIIKTDSEISALIKESELIKKHKPKFNVLMRDSKNYLYIGFSREEFPKIVLMHQPIRNWKPARPAGGLEIRNYIGPFTDANAIRKSLKVLRDIFPYCTCKKKHAVKCLNAHMGKCPGFCCLKNSFDVPRDSDRTLREQYLKNIRAIKSILSGKSQSVLKELKKEIGREIKSQNFERASEIKKQIEGFESILAHAKVIDEKPELPSPSIFKDSTPDLKLLGLKRNPERIETYDISNIQGGNAVGSMVVFELQPDGNYAPNKNEYRKFKIKTVSGANDTAMITEVISRRLKNRWPLPQLIIVDGGRGQLNAALKALENKKINIVSLAKLLEEIYIPGKKEPILAQSLGNSIKHLFMRIRDEAHRFAIGYHRKLRRKALTPALEKDN